MRGNIRADVREVHEVEIEGAIYLTLQGAAKELGISYWTLMDRVNDNHVGLVRFGGQLLIRRKSLYLIGGKV